MCDLTICSEDAIIYDLHYDIGSVPGDGIHSCFPGAPGRQASGLRIADRTDHRRQNGLGIRNGE